MVLFLKKQLKFSCTYQPLSFCKILKKFLEPIQSYEDVPFSGPKQPICPEKSFFGTNHCYYFHLPIGPFHCAKFKKHAYSRSRVMRLCHFWVQNGSFTPNKFFWENLLISFLFTYQGRSLCKILKNYLGKSKVMRMCNFWAKNGQFAQMRIFFFRKSVNEPCSFH